MSEGEGEGRTYPLAVSLPGVAFCLSLTRDARLAVAAERHLKDDAVVVSAVRVERVRLGVTLCSLRATAGAQSTDCRTCASSCVLSATRGARRWAIAQSTSASADDASPPVGGQQGPGMSAVGPTASIPWARNVDGKNKNQAEANPYLCSGRRRKVAKDLIRPHKTQRRCTLRAIPHRVRCGSPGAATSISHSGPRTSPPEPPAAAETKVAHTAAWRRACGASGAWRCVAHLVCGAMPMVHNAGAQCKIL